MTATTNGDPTTLPRIGLDLFGCARPKVTGWERYAINLNTAVAEVIASETDPDLELVTIRGRAASEVPARYAVQGLRHFANGVRKETKGQPLSIYHAPTFPPGRVSKGTRVVWTVHDDLILGGHAEYARRGAMLWVPLAKSRLKHVDAFVTFTQTVRIELVRHGIPDAKIHVVRPAAPEMPSVGQAPKITDASGKPVAMPAQFVLCVGTIEPRKRPDFAVALAREVDVPVLFVGTANGINPADLGDHALFAGRASDQELAWCYAHAAALVSPSAYEGVDFPLYEALSSGLRVAASDIAVHRELAGPNVEMFDGFSVPDGARALTRAMESRTEPVRVLDTWTQAAQNYLEIYRSLL